LSLPPDSSKDDQLHIRDLPNITVGDWQQAPEGSDVSGSIEVDVEDRLLYTAQEMAEGITIEGEEEDIATDSGDDSEAQFDYDSESDFDDDVDGDEDEGDENM
jgi:hypothetical protein